MNSVCIVQLVFGMWLALPCQIMSHIIKTSKPSKYNSLSSNSYTILIVFRLLGGCIANFSPSVLKFCLVEVCTVLVYIHNWYVFICSPLKLYLENVINLKLTTTIDSYSQYVPISAGFFLLCILTSWKSHVLISYYKEKSPDTGWELLWSIIIQIGHWEVFNTVPISQSNSVEISLSTYDLSSQRLFVPWVVPISLCR